MDNNKDILSIIHLNKQKYKINDKINDTIKTYINKMVDMCKQKKYYYIYDDNSSAQKHLYNFLNIEKYYKTINEDLNIRIHDVLLVSRDNYYYNINLFLNNNCDINEKLKSICNLLNFSHCKDLKIKNDDKLDYIHDAIIYLSNIYKSEFFNKIIYFNKDYINNIIDIYNKNDINIKFDDIKSDKYKVYVNNILTLLKDNGYIYEFIKIIIIKNYNIYLNNNDKMIINNIKTKLYNINNYDITSESESEIIDKTNYSMIETNEIEYIKYKKALNYMDICNENYKKNSHYYEKIFNEIDNEHVYGLDGYIVKQKDKYYYYQIKNLKKFEQRTSFICLYFNNYFDKKYKYEQFKKYNNNILISYKYIDALIFDEKLPTIDKYMDCSNKLNCVYKMQILNYIKVSMLFDNTLKKDINEMFKLKIINIIYKDIEKIEYNKLYIICDFFEKIIYNIV